MGSGFSGSINPFGRGTESPLWQSEIGKVTPYQFFFSLAGEQTKSGIDALDDVSARLQLPMGMGEPSVTDRSRSERATGCLSLFVWSDAIDRLYFVAYIFPRALLLPGKNWSMDRSRNRLCPRHPQ